MPAQTSGSLSATGSVTLTKPATDTFAYVQVSGTYGTVTFVIEGSIDGTNYFAVTAYGISNGSVVSGTVAPSDNTTVGYKVPADGISSLRVRVTAIASGTLDVSLNSHALVGVMEPRATNLSGLTFGASTFTDDLTLSSGAELILDTPSTLAAAGSAQGDAAAVVDQVTFVTAADGTKGVVLPGATAGLVRLVYNTHATNGLKVWPASGDDVNDGTQDAAVTIEGKTLAVFVGLDSTTWAAIYTANS